MKKTITTIFIDAANLHKGVESLKWKLDYQRFSVWLKEKYKADNIYLFIGLIAKYKDLYTYLQESGYTLIFKETVFDHNGKVKGNCDADLVLHAVQGYYEKKYTKCLLVTSDGDFSSLVKFLIGKKVFHTLISPAKQNRCSILLKRLNVPIVFLNDIRQKVSK